MTLTAMEQAGLGLFGGLAQRHAARQPRLRVALERANMGRSPEVYLAFVYLVALAALVEGLAVLGLAALALPAAGMAVPGPVLALLALLPAAMPGAVLGLGMLWPEMRARERAADIERMLPGALNYMAAMASSGMAPDRIVGSLARQRIYGQVAEEAHRIDTRVRWAGMDLLSALREAIPVTPSHKLQDVWQGMVSTISSGASLKSYLLSKAEQMHRDNAGEQRRDLETLGLLAESFLVVAVAAPVFLILLLTMMGTSGGGSESATLIMWLLVLVLLPVAQGGFAFVVHSMRRRVQ